jgi:MYXO-CTERM domain-containing protein
MSKTVALVAIVVCAVGGTAAGQANIVATKVGLDFGQVVVGQSTSLTVDFVNTGLQAGTINSVTISGNAGFSHDAKPPIQLAAGAQTTVTVTFSPIVGGQHNAVLKADTGVLNPPMVALAGTAIAPTLGIAPTALDFGTVAVGMSSDPQTVGMKAGAVTLHIVSIVASDPSFVIDTAQTQLTLTPNAITTFTVTFAPRGPGVVTAKIFIKVAEMATPIQQVDVRGAGMGGFLDLSSGGGPDLGAAPPDLAVESRDLATHVGGHGGASSCALGDGRSGPAPFALLGLGLLLLRRRARR